MVEPAPLQTLLPSLQTARPPTPPRESNHQAPKSVGFLGLGRFFHKTSSSLSSNAPKFTPDSSAESTNQSASTSRKKVGFSECLDYSEPPEVLFDGKGEIKHAVQPLPPSARRKPSKSILKQPNGLHDESHTSLGGNKLLYPHHHASFATMLESIVQQLAGKDRSSRQDAYLMLAGSLKASDNVPDMKALKEKMPLLCQFIWRDVSEKLENGNTGSTLAIKALALLSSFLQKPTITETFPAEFPMTIVDHAIKAFEEGSASKDITKHLMFVLAQQNFSPKVMNQERTSRLLTALHDIENHVKGKSIAMGRLDILRTLLRQSKSHLLFNTIWVKDLFADMLSSLSEVRTPAIIFGLEASLILGRETNASRAVSNLLKTGTDLSEEKEGVTFADYYAGRLCEMVANQAVRSTVPRIWSVIILFLRSKPQTLEQWPYMKLFLGVWQKCINSSDTATRIEANFAWNRFVFAIQPNERTPKNMRAILCTVLVDQLQKRKAYNASSRKATLGSVCNLLYYALKPNAPPTQLDLYWDEYVVSIVGSTLVAGTRSDPDFIAKDATDACIILRGLFDTTTSHQRWSESRAMDNFQQNSVEAKDLPALDSKWLRNRYARVFPLLGPLLEKLFWDLGEDKDVTKLWESYITSIASPMRMEVKVSIDAMGCVASLFSLLHKIWKTGPKGMVSLQPSKEPSFPQSTSAFLRSFEKLVSAAINGLGLLPFTEKLLCITQDTFIPVATPSHHPKKPRGVTMHPLHHLVSLLVTVSPNLQYDASFSIMIHNILHPFFESRTSSKSRIDLVKDLLVLLPTESTRPCMSMWQVLADFAATATDTRDERDSNRSSEQLPGIDYREVIQILESGVKISPKQPLPGWMTLFTALANAATIDAGDAGRAIAVIEPVVKCLLPSLQRTTLAGPPYLHLILGKTKYPRDQQALDAAKRRMWGTENAGPKSATFDPYDKLYEYIKESLTSAYDSLSQQNQSDHADIISSFANLLSGCPTELLMNLLVKAQDGLAYWFVDGKRKLNGGTALSHSVLNLWTTVARVLPGLLKQKQSTHTKVLSKLAPLISSGLESKNRSISKKAIILWNTMFGTCENGLEYPEQVKVALLQLYPEADLQLPFFPDSLETDNFVGHREQVESVDSQDELSISSMETTFKPHKIHLDAPAIRRVRQSTPQVVIGVGHTQSRKRSREATPETSIRKSRKRDVTPRLRHDDSQVQFEAIESSPMADRAVDSQLLTEKQKEVKERQQADAAMFPNIGSSPLPRARSVEKSAEDPELPIHRSSSKMRAMLSPNPARQTTPTLVLPSDDDQNVLSSPTPTRSLRGEPLQDPPSSPPEVVARKEQDYSQDISSSPPEVTPEPDDDITTSVVPSAQIDHYAFQINRTFESTPMERGSSPVDPSAQLLATEAEHQLRTAAIEEAADEELVHATAEESLDPVTNPQMSDTPPRDEPISPVARQGTLQFEDARSSPASSDKNTANEEVFEDAFSSPGLNTATTRPKSSSPISDADESSMLRVVAEYDRGSGRIADQHSVVGHTKLEAHRTSPSSSKQTSPSGAASPHNDVQSLRLPHGKEVASPFEVQKPSSDPSLIPETPAAKPNEDSMLDSEGEELDMDDTIIVDTSSLREGFYQPKIKSGYGQGRRVQVLVPEISPRRRQVTYSRKRKLETFVAADANEVPDSQDVKAVLEKAPKKRTSPSKKQRKGPGRPKRALQASQQTDTEAETEPSQSPSVDLDASMQGIEIGDSTMEVLNSSANDKALDGGVTDIEVSVDDAMEVIQLNKDIRSTPNQDVNMEASAAEDTSAEASPSRSHRHQTSVSTYNINFLSNASAAISPRKLKAPADVELQYDSPEVVPTAKEGSVQFVSMEATGNGSPKLPTSVIESPAVNANVSMASSAAENLNITPTADELVANVADAATVANFDPTTSDIERVEETIINEGTFDTELSPAAELIAPNKDLFEEIAPATTLKVVEALPEPSMKQLSPEIASDPVLEDAIVRSLKEKLQSLIAEMQIAALSRQDVRDMEDLFDDAKEQLYGAGRRGRETRI